MPHHPAYAQLKKEKLVQISEESRKAYLENAQRVARESVDAQQEKNQPKNPVKIKPPKKAAVRKQPKPKKISRSGRVKLEELTQQDFHDIHQSTDSVKVLALRYAISQNLINYIRKSSRFSVLADVG